ncbi:MAG: PQQ-binding-like beta-propeller repeat protein [Peptococcaceae bacterium]|jgi:outer membrane protein assembly factor BamB|nr:PQQ-binding-like beta-propeller repeat protein [Peptococcaceae bacterium]MDH7524944.1 PQQ-binding-like beta-propeller repeat protein [Peptococcaceae bacterium]
MLRLPIRGKSRLFVLAAVLVLVVGGCSQDGRKSGHKPASLKPHLELVHEISLGNAAEDRIPDVTTDRWSFGVQPSMPLVAPDGKHVLVVKEEKMSWFDISTGAEKWSRATYGGISSYVVDDARLYMIEKYANKRDKEHGYIICLDSDTGKELWKYDVQKDLAPAVSKHKPQAVPPDICCYIKTALDAGKVYVIGSTSWSEGINKNKAEILLCLDQNGRQIWKREYYGYPGLISMSNMKVVAGKLVMGNYSYGDEINGPACVHAFDINTGEEVWKYDIENDPGLASSKSTNVAADVVGDKIIAVANFGKVYILDVNGRKIKDFIVFKPEQYQNVTLYTSVYNSGLAPGQDEIIIAPGSTIVKGASNVKAQVEHPDANSIMVYDLNGNMKWKFRLGGKVSSLLVKGKFLLLGTMHNQYTMDYDYCGVYAFDLTQEASSTELNMAEKSVVDRYIGFYRTDGAVLYDCLGASQDGQTICATTWPTRVGVNKFGRHGLYVLKIQ